jgi:signal transduction histidine kinase
MTESSEFERGEMSSIDVVLMQKLTSVVGAARRRATSLRDRARPDEVEKVGWVAEALQELDVAHEELRVTEEALSLQADQLIATRGVLGVERDHYRELFEESPEPYLVTDLRGVILQANRQACRLLEVDGAFLPGKPIAVFVSLEDRRLLRDMLEQPAAPELVSRFALRLLPPGAPSPIVTEVSLSCGWLRSGQASTLRFVLHRPTSTGAGATQPGMSEEATPVQPLVRSERSNETRTEEQREQRTALLTTIYDELRLPLGGMHGWLEFLADKKAVLPLRERARQAIARHVDVLGRMLEQLIDHWRASEELLAIRPRETDLGDLVRECVESRQDKAMVEGIDLSAEIEAKLPLAYVDPAGMRQAVMELLNNALSFTPRGGSIRVRASAADGVFTITIEDNGRGIHEKSVTRILEPFVRLPGAGRRAPGLGLGLSIAHHLVQLHGGTLTAASAGEGQGATFLLSCPVTPPQIVPLSVVQ